VPTPLHAPPLVASQHSELALDARHIGNEGRFVNDYRNTGRRANVEFRLRRDARGELRQGIFVCAKEGISAGEELLISYGKSFWRSRIGNLEDFIVRRPGEDTPLSGSTGGCTAAHEESGS
jgi:SET domain-containing protein